MQCRFKVYGDGQALAEHVDEVADQNDADAINRIMRIARVKALAAAPGKSYRDFQIEGPEFSEIDDAEKAALA